MKAKSRQLIPPALLLTPPLRLMIHSQCGLWTVTMAVLSRPADRSPSIVAIHLMCSVAWSTSFGKSRCRGKCISSVRDLSVYPSSSSEVSCSCCRYSTGTAFSLMKKYSRGDRLATSEVQFASSTSPGL
uniref:(northern house mosquito) hypothetical protein n=1 Tax=Culex pipiens TaxID=7175 RepID=A0A8D8L804_CULPI